MNAAVKSNGLFKKMGALVMALGLTCALAATASAATVVDENTTTYSVTIYKAGKDTTSMANDIVAGDAVVTTVEEGVQVDIPIKPIEDYRAMGIMPAADGYLQSVEVPEAVSAEVIKNSDSDMYTEGTLRIVLSEMPSDGRIEVTNSYITLYKANTDTPYTLMSHIKAEFDIALTK